MQAAYRDLPPEDVVTGAERHRLDHVPPDDVAQRLVRGIVRLVREPLVEAAECEARPPVVSLYERKARRWAGIYFVVPVLYPVVMLFLLVSVMQAKKIWILIQRRLASRR